MAAVSAARQTGCERLAVWQGVPGRGGPRGEGASGARDGRDKRKTAAKRTGEEEEEKRLRWQALEV